MKLPFVLKPRLQDRIVVFFVVLLMAVQLASFYFIRYAIEQTAQGTLRDELRVGARVFRRLLEQNSQQLVESTSVLTYDFGFRQAIATRDHDTILSALRNHGARINASGMAVIGLDKRIVADTLGVGSAGQPYPYPDLIARADRLGRTAGIRLIGGKPFQVIVVPVLAPMPIAWVSMSFLIDDAAARDLQRLTSSDVTFVRRDGQRAELLATTLPALQRDALLATAHRVVDQGRNAMTVTLGEHDYEVLATPLEDTSPPRLFAILQKSVEEGRAPYLALQAALLAIAGLAIAITLAGAVRIARRITSPLERLAGAAREVAEGNYGVRVGAVGEDEIAEVAGAFDRMARGLAERDSMRDALGKVASSEVVTQLLRGQIELGGEEREVTVMFSDIRNFTTISEELTPQQVLAMLNEFLTVIGEVVEKHGGVVDKYLGDGAMALFGAPVTRADDTQRALDCALEIRERIEALGPALAARGLPHPEVGIGINTSYVIAGNIGSPSRLNYTVLGDGVNLASRLEGLTKRYLVPIVVGNLTHERASGIVFRELDKVRVRGKTVPERIFEPLGFSWNIAPAELARLELWHSALAHYRGRRWVQAREGFMALAEERTYARLVALYMGYLRDIAANPPAMDWDAAFTLYEK